MRLTFSQLRQACLFASTLSLAVICFAAHSKQGHSLKASIKFQSVLGSWFFALIQTRVDLCFCWEIFGLTALLVASWFQCLSRPRCWSPSLCWAPEWDRTSPCWGGRCRSACVVVMSSDLELLTYSPSIWLLFLSLACLGSDHCQFLFDLTFALTRTDEARRASRTRRLLVTAKAG